MTEFGIGGLAILMAALVVYATMRTSGIRPAVLVAAGAMIMMAAQYALSAAGLLRQWGSTPPPFFLMLLVTVVITIRFATSLIGGRLAEGLPFAVLIASQAFRLPLELTMHHAYSIGLMPKQMSYSGCNFDIVTGATAIVVAVLAARGHAPRGLIIAWNTMGCLLLLTIVTIAAISTPRFAMFGNEYLNTWIADPPYVWLPGVLVQTALLGHLLIWRKLFFSPKQSS